MGGGGACLTASSIYVAGDTQGSCINPTPDTGMDPIADPLDYLNPPTDNGCDHVALVEVKTDTVLDPGVYCGGIAIFGGPIVDFNSGEYIIKGEGLSITGNSIVTGDEVMFYLSPDITGEAYPSPSGTTRS